jgi:hypothetical protein
MIAVIRIAPFELFYYWKKPVKGCLGRSCQIDCFIAVTGTQCWFVLSSGNHEKWLQVENNRLITALHTTEIIQIPIVFQHTASSPCLRPAVSSLGACPTPAR